jgi:hypothetical protein
VNPLARKVLIAVVPILAAALARALVRRWTRSHDEVAPGDEGGSPAIAPVPA